MTSIGPYIIQVATSEAHGGNVIMISTSTHFHELISEECSDRNSI